MKRVSIIAGLGLIAALLGAPGSACAEELILKDGQKIEGTIIGYEDDMFRVKTSYGIALVRKDKVVSIQVSTPEPAIHPTPPPPATKTVEVKPAHVAAAPVVAPALATPPPAPTVISVKPTHIAATPVTAPTTATPAPAPTVISVKPAPVAPPPPALARASSAPTPANPPMPPPPPVATKALDVKPPTPPPLPVSHPLDVPMPTPLHEHVDGNAYFNDTFQFSMFKPPDWKIFEGVPKETGSGIMAMGTEDEQTLLIVNRQVWSGPPSLTSDQIEAKLRQTYQEYRPISEESFDCDGQKAIRRTFSGILDGAEWHGVTVHVIHQNMVFGITGLTAAETFEFQEAIFNKIIKTFHFLPSSTPTTAAPQPERNRR